MRFSEVLAASLVAPMVAAHGDAMIPKVFGLPKHLKNRDLFASHRHAAVHVEAPKLHIRQEEGRCGPQGNNAVCGAGECCSAEGYCGVSQAHCQAPDCQINFGPGCDALKTPNGATTRNDPRPQLGNIEYGGIGIRSCVKKNTVALTYDDGPYIYTDDVLAEFDKYNAKATFFITGNNIGKGAIDENWRGVIERMYAKGHQIASHTWSHQNLDEITQEQRYDQMVKNEMAIRNILGKYPTYMRPPYSACDTAACQADLKALGYVVTSFDLDTDDYNQLSEEKIQNAKNNFKSGIDAAKTEDEPQSRLSIAHDIHELSAHTLTNYMLQYLYDNGFTAVTVGECMGDPVANWYRDSTPAPPSTTSASSSAPVPTPTGPTTQNGACGFANTEGQGQSCIGFIGPDGLSECCSPAGWCGNSADYCQTGCNPLFGKCGAQPSAVVSSTSSGPVPTPTGPTTQNGACGFANTEGQGQSCIGFINGADGLSECCSPYGWCGNSAAYCGTGCNPLYGKCGSSGSISSSAVSASASATASVSQSASASAVSSSAVISSSAVLSSSVVASSSAVVSSSAVITSSAVVSSSAVASSSAVVSSSALSSASAATSVQASSEAHSSSASASASVSASASASASVSASASAVTSGAQSSAASASASGSSAAPSRSASSVQASSQTASVSASVPTSASSTPAPTQGSSTTPGQASSSAAQSDASSVKPTSTIAQSTGGYGANPSTIATVVKPSETPCTTSSSATPTPTKPVSKDGKCGKENGGQTCAGYKNGLGWAVECCCKESGRCSTDPWACGVGCDKLYGNCFSG